MEKQFGKTSEIRFEEIDGNIVAIKKIVNSKFIGHEKIISLDELFNNEIYWLNKLKDFDRVPNILNYNSDLKEIMMEYVGERISKDNIPEDWIYQMEYILEKLDEYGCRHNDISPKEILIKDKIIYLIDFGWATNSCKVDYSDLPPMLGGQFKYYLGFNDKYSFIKSISYIINEDLK